MWVHLPALGRKSLVHVSIEWQEKRKIGVFQRRKDIGNSIMNQEKKKKGGGVLLAGKVDFGQPGEMKYI